MDPCQNKTEPKSIPVLEVLSEQYTIFTSVSLFVFKISPNRIPIPTAKRYVLEACWQDIVLYKNVGSLIDPYLQGRSPKRGNLAPAFEEGILVFQHCFARAQACCNSP